MACFHGVPGGFCAVCAGTVMHRDEGHPVAKPEIEPRFAKGRDSAKWVGYGQFALPHNDHSGLRAAAEAGSVHRGRFGRSEWAASLERAHERPEPPVTPQQRLQTLRILAVVRGAQVQQ